MVNANSRATGGAPFRNNPMKTQQFKTTINCGNCLRAVTPILNAETAIQEWQVDTASPDKLLTVRGDVPAERVCALLTEAGFEAQPIA